MFLLLRTVESAEFDFEDDASSQPMHRAHRGEYRSITHFGLVSEPNDLADITLIAVETLEGMILILQ